MTYCLQTEDGKVRIEIHCTLANRPNTVGDLVLGVREGRIEMIRPKNLSKRLKAPGACCINDELNTDWERTGGQPRYINWIPTEEL